MQNSWAPSLSFPGLTARAHKDSLCEAQTGAPPTSLETALGRRGESGCGSWQGRRSRRALRDPTDLAGSRRRRTGADPIRSGANPAGSGMDRVGRRPGGAPRGGGHFGPVPCAGRRRPPVSVSQRARYGVPLRSRPGRLPHLRRPSHIRPRRPAAMLPRWVRCSGSVSDLGNKAGAGGYPAVPVSPARGSIILTKISDVFTRSYPSRS